MSYCRNCGKKLGEDFDFCPECGIAVNSPLSDNSEAFEDIPTKKCWNCGEKMPIDMFYCLNCGQQFDEFGRIKEQEIPIIQKQGEWRNKWTSFFLCLFFGWVGAHKFYESKPVFGVVYLLTCGLFGIGWVADMIILATKPNPYQAK